MTEEIKEILEHLSTTAKQINNAWTIFSVEECKGLYDYITNLQQENEKLKYNARGQVNDYFKDKYVDEVLKKVELQQENKILKENAEHNDKVVDKARWNEMIYKSRCKKANEWIDKHQQTIENMRKEKFYILNLGVDDLKEFKNILNGSDEK